MMRVVFAAWFLAHGIAHLPGFLVSWKLWSVPSLPFHTSVLANTVDVGTVGIRLVGLGWFFCCIGFIALAIGALLRLSWWHDAAYVILSLSLILCVLGWPQSRIGVASNVVVSVLLLASTRYGWV